jgi:hypothetical protein
MASNWKDAWCMKLAPPRNTDNKSCSSQEEKLKDLSVPPVSEPVVKVTVLLKLKLKFDRFVTVIMLYSSRGLYRLFQPFDIVSLTNLYYSPNIIRLIEPKRIIWAGHVARTRKVTKLCSGNLKAGDHLAFLGVCWRIIVLKDQK